MRLYNPVDKATIAFATLSTTDRERIVLPDAKFEQSAADNRRHIHDSSVGERVHHLIAKASLDFQSICIGHVAVTGTLASNTTRSFTVSPLSLTVRGPGDFTHTYGVLVSLPVKVGNHECGRRKWNACRLLRQSDHLHGPCRALRALSSSHSNRLVSKCPRRINAKCRFQVLI